MAIPQGKREKVNHDPLVHSEMWYDATMRAMSTRNDDEVDTWIVDTAACQFAVTRRVWHAESHANRHVQCNDCLDNASTPTKCTIVSAITVLTSPGSPPTLMRVHEGVLIKNSDQSESLLHP